MVTAPGPDGRGTVVDDRIVEPTTVSTLPGYVWHRIWSRDHGPGSEPVEADHPTHFPPPGGIRFYHYEAPPHTEVEATHDPDELEAALPGRAAHVETEQAGLHTTASLDLVMILEGEITLELGDGSRTRLTPGDAVVQHGATHAWRNTGSGPCRLVVALIGYGPT